VAYQSEIELRVKVLDKELDELERRLKNIQNPFDVSGKRKGTRAQAAAVRSQIAEADLIRRSIEDLDRLREAKAEKRLRTNIRRVRYLRSQRIAAVRQVERVEDQLAKKRRDAVGSGIIGGAFPLLFGQGAGAAVGGGLGGAAGGLMGGQFGFGLSLVGTALGTSFDTLVEGAKKLGAALNPLTADISAITTASGLSGSKLEKLILDLEKTGNAAGALSLATEELEKVIGKRGVEALKEFSQTTKDLSNDFEVFLTRFKAFMADVFNTLISPRSEVALKKRGETIAAARESTDPQIQRAISKLDAASTISERLRIQEVIVSLVEQEEQARRRELELQIASKGEAAAKLREIEASVAEKRIELEIELLNAAANDKTRIALEKKLAFQQKITEEQALYNQYAREEIDIAVLRAKIGKADIDYKKRIARIDNAAAAADLRDARKGRRGAKPPESRALSLQRAIARERLGISELEMKILNIGQDRLSVALEEARQIEVRKKAQIEAVEYARQDALNKNKVKGDEALINELYDARLLRIRNIAELASAENDVLIERIALQRELAKLAGERETEDIGIGLRRQIGAVERRISSPFGDQDSEMLELRIKQVQRQEDAYRALDRQIDDVNRRLEDAPGNEDLQQELRLLEGRRLKYQELLPVLDQVEQKELQMQQTLQKLQPLTNALSQGLTDLFTGLIDGSKDAQEVFAAMLKNMGQALIQQGAVMIAQYIAIGIARMFAGMGGGNRVGPENFNLEGFGPLAPTPGAAFAEGGFVTGPTRALVGEGGQPEYIIPEDKMKESMTRYSRGARGSAVIPQSGETSTAGADGGVAIADKPIDVRYSVERINNVDYVTADQFQAGMRQAAQQGAKQGEQQTLRRLQMSSSTRRRLGV
jgi:SLT domain-containing protein